MFTDTEEIWIDAVPGADKHVPFWQLDKVVTNKTKDMALYEVIGNVNGETVTLTPEFTDAVNVLMMYGVIDINGNFNVNLYESIIANANDFQAQELSDAMAVITESNTIGYSFGEKIIHGVSVVSMFVPGIPNTATAARLIFSSSSISVRTSSALKSEPDKTRLNKVSYSDCNS